MKNYKVLFLICTVAILIGCNSNDSTVVEKESNDSIPSDTIASTGLPYIYDIKSLPSITLNISTEEWNKLLSYFDQNPDNEEYIKSNFLFVKDGKSVALNYVGLRIRGNTSRRRPEGISGETHSASNPSWHHASFALSFKKFVTGQKMAGAEKINLKWFKDDASYSREVYCYDLFERFGVWTAPQSSYCKLSIKINEDASTAYYGIYQLVEPIDKEYLKNRLGKYADSGGNLWKANWGADFKNPNLSQMGIEVVSLNKSECYTPVYDLKTNEPNLATAKAQLADFISNLNSKSGEDFKNWISSKMDVPLFLKTYAVNVICGMWDDYWNNKNNFYFYFDSSGKFYFIPYDYDNTLGTSGIMADAGKQNPLKWGNSTHPLVTKIIAIQEYKELYVGYLKELCNADKNYFHYAKSTARIINWQNKIRPYINNDTKEDTELKDVPASWGNCSFYRLLDNNNNFFIVKAASIANE